MIATRSLFSCIALAIAASRAPAQAPDARHDVRAGRVDSLVVGSAIYGADRTVWVYTPPGYDGARGEYPFLLAFDGSDYTTGGAMNVPTLLDSLVAARATPSFVAVMVDDGSGAARIAELGNSARFLRFLAEELIPWVREHYRVTHDPRRTIVTGSSAGGLAAAYGGFARPDLFGNVLAQSGAFWRGAEGSNAPPWEWLTAQVAGTPKREVRFLLDVGSRETVHVLGGSGPAFIEANRRFRDALVAKGYAVTYTEVTGGVHAPLTWRPRFPLDLVALTRDWPRTSR